MPSVTEESLKVELGEGANFKEAWDTSSRYSEMLNHMKSPTALTFSKKKDAFTVIYFLYYPIPLTTQLKQQEKKFVNFALRIVINQRKYTV